MATGTGELELEAGGRISVELSAGGTCVALVERIEGDIVEVRLLDDVPSGELNVSSVVDVFSSRHLGLCHWSARITHRSPAGDAFLEVLGPAQVVQRRVHRRADVDFPATARPVRAGRRGKSNDARIANISRGGMKLVGGRVAGPGETMEVTVDLGTGQLSLTGRVVMSTFSPDGEPVAHLAFSDVLAPALVAIDDYVAQH